MIIAAPTFLATLSLIATSSAAPILDLIGRTFFFLLDHLFSMIFVFLKTYVAHMKPVMISVFEFANAFRAQFTVSSKH